MFRALGFDAFHGFFEDQGIAIDCLLARETKLAVDFVPVLGVLGLVRLGLPVRDVAFYEGEPELGVGAAKLGGGLFEKSLAGLVSFDVFEERGLGVPIVQDFRV